MDSYLQVLYFSIRGSLSQRQSASKLLEFAMGKAQSKPEDSKSKELEEAKQIMLEKGFEGAQIVMREKLEEWSNVKIKFGVTGMSGVGKSSFINSVRGLCGHVSALLNYAETDNNSYRLTPTFQ